MSSPTPKHITVASLQPELWTSSATEVLKLFVTDSTGATNFPPIFTYPIFGDAETIYGYKDLVIFLCYDHYTFKPFLNVKYSEKLDDPEIEDLQAKLMKFLPASTIFKDEQAWVDSIAQEKKGYSIPGESYGTFHQGDDEFEIYKLNLKDPKGLELHTRLQILVLLFIEAGSYIDSSDELWDVYVLYKKTGTEPSIVGFSTVYNYWKYAGANKFDSDTKEIRKKISQFIVFPTHQGQGIGQAFYGKLFSQWLVDPSVFEVVIEDPNESFDDMRDLADLKRLNSSVDLASINKDITAEWIQKTRSSLKLEKRQFSRLLEMVLLYKLKNGVGSDTKREVRLFIKRRLFEKNKEGLTGLDENSRKDKLQTAYETLEEDYYRILGNVKLTFKRKESEDLGGEKRLKLE